MDKSEFLELNLPSRDNPTDIADINAVSDNFRIIDSTFLKLVEEVNQKFQTRANINLNFDDDSTNEEQYPSVPAVVNFTNRKIDPLKIVNSASGNAIALKDSAKYKLEGLKLYGKTTQNGTPTPDAPVPLVSVGDSGSFTVKIQGKNVEEQTLTIADTLRSFGDIKDEKDFTRGVTIKKLGSSTITSDDTISCNSINTYTSFFIITKSNDEFAKLNVEAISDYFPPKVCYNADEVGIYSHTNGVALRIYNSFLADISTKENALQSFKNWLSGKTINVIYQLPNTIETPLTETELNAYRQLHTNKPNTTILSEADMEVDYVADPKLYIDNKIAELTALTLEV